MKLNQEFSLVLDTLLTPSKPSLKPLILRFVALLVPTKVLFEGTNLSFVIPISSYFNSTLFISSWITSQMTHLALYYIIWRLHVVLNIQLFYISFVCFLLVSMFVNKVVTIIWSKTIFIYWYLSFWHSLRKYRSSYRTRHRKNQDWTSTPLIAQFLLLKY